MAHNIDVIKYDENINNESFKDRKNNIYIEKTSPLCTDCTICLEKFLYNDNVIKLRCYHVFHPNCIDKWLNQRINTSSVINTCPTCRQII